MRYEGPIKLTETEIIEKLNDKTLTSQERVKVVLSALYYGNSIEFSGDILIGEFERASFDEKNDLRNLFETFYQMCRTDYRIKDSLLLLFEYKKSKPELCAEIDVIIQSITEYATIFKGRN